MKYGDIAKIRTALADYMVSEGCSCCEGESHGDDKEKLAKMLAVPQYDDGSGYDFYQFKSQASSS